MTTPSTRSARSRPISGGTGSIGSESCTRRVRGSRSAPTTTWWTAVGGVAGRSSIPRAARETGCSPTAKSARAVLGSLRGSSPSSPGSSSGGSTTPIPPSKPLTAHTCFLVARSTIPFCGSDENLPEPMCVGCGRFCKTNLLRVRGFFVTLCAYEYCFVALPFRDHQMYSSLL